MICLKKVALGITVKPLTYGMITKPAGFVIIPYYKT